MIEKLTHKLLQMRDQLVDVRMCNAYLRNHAQDFYLNPQHHDDTAKILADVAVIKVESTLRDLYVVAETLGVGLPREDMAA